MNDRRGRQRMLSRFSWLPVHLLAATMLVAGVAASGLRAQERPLPDVATLLRETREHLRDDWRLERRYRYSERRTEYERGDDGRDKVKSVRLFEVLPTADGRPYRRLVEVNGRKLTPQELDNEDRERQKRIADRQRESAADRQRRADREAERQREEQATWDDLARVYAFTTAGRETLDGRQLVVVDFQPRPGAQPLTDNGRRMLKVKGRAWISEDSFQVVRVDAVVLDDISIGWGLIGKLYAGAKASYLRQKVNEELWLPRQLSFTGSGRVLVKRFTLHNLIEYFDYRRSG